MAPYVEPCICGLFNFLTINEKHPAPIPLQGVSVSVKVVDFVAEVTIEQQYKNKEEKPIEAIYIFPLDHDSAVHTFEADIDGRQLVGVVKEKEEAKKEYEEALERGDTAVMLQQVKREIFKARIGNIPPGKNASVKIAYYTELLPDESAVRFYLPTTIAPRYRPASDTSEGAKEISSITYTDFTPAPLKVEVKFEMKSKIIRIESPTHQIKTTIEATENAHKMFGATATLAAETTDMDKDFVVLVSTENPHVPRICLETNSEHDTTAAVLTVVPKFELHDQKVELIFVIDRSGSMHGESIAKAKEALKLFLHSLPVDCYVNIVGFGSSYEVLFKNGSKKYDDVVLKECSMHASSLDAELGGTEILEPLREVLDWKPIEGYLRQVFVLTDGEVSNTEQVIQYVRQNAHKTRVFSLGIGDCASHELVEGISRAGNGTSEFVSYNENLKSKVIKQLKHALQPALSKVSVKWGDLEAESSVVEINKVKTLLGYGTPKKVPPKTTLMQAPYIIPPVFNGTRTLVYCIFEKANVPKQVILTAESPDGPLSVTLEVKDEEIYEGKILHRLAARKLIRDLEDGVSWLGSSATDEVKKEVIHLGCKYGVASSYTSFIAVDKNTNAGFGKEFEIVAREVPSQMAFGWGGGFTSVAFSCPSPMRMRMGGMPMALCAPMPHQLKMCSFNKSSSQVKVKRRCKSNYVSHEASSREAFSEDYVSDEAVSQEESAESDPLAALIELQQFDGQFRADTSMPSLISSSENAIIEGATDNKVSKEVWATAIAIAFMEDKYPDRKDEWELVSEKAMKWLKKNVAGDVEDLIQKAKVFVKKCLG